MKRWPESDTLRFVELYRDHECLWNSGLESYRNSRMRQDAFADIVRKMNIEDFTVTEARQKVKSLRNTFNQELAKIEKSKQVNPDDVYVPSVKWFTMMDHFLKKITETKLAKNNYDNQAELDNYSLERTSIGDVSEDFEVDVKDEELTSDFPSEILTLPGTSNSSKRPLAYKHYHVSTQSALPEVKRRRQTQPEENEFDTFCRFLAAAMKTLPEHLAIQCQGDMMATLTQYRLMSIGPQQFPESITSTEQPTSKHSSSANSNEQDPIYIKPSLRPQYSFQ